MSAYGGMKAYLDDLDARHASEVGNLRSELAEALNKLRAAESLLNAIRTTDLRKSDGWQLCCGFCGTEPDRDCMPNCLTWKIAKYK